eukprot:12429757-Karenia_brevis.AAC.2
MTQSAELATVVFKAVEVLEKKSQQHCGHCPVSFAYALVEGWRYNWMTHARVMLILKNGEFKEEYIKNIRLDHVKKRGLTFPWAEYYRLQMRLKAAQQTAQHGHPIEFLSLEHVRYSSKEAAYFAKFQYKHVHEHATAWSDEVKQYVVEARVDNLLRGDPIPDDPVENYLPGRFRFTAGFFQSLPESLRYEVRIKFAEKDLAEKQACEQEYSWMNVQDMESIAREARVSPKTVSFLRNLINFPETSFTSPSTFKDVTENPDKMFQDINGLTNVFWRHLSGYEVREYRSKEDMALFKMCCEVRNGPNRYRAAQDLHSFFDRIKINMKDAQEHAYSSRLFSIFIDFLSRGPLCASHVKSLLETSEDFAEAVECEFGHWPFAHGMKRCHKEAMDAFATKFARCSEAPWLTEHADPSKCESIFEALQKSAEAHQKHLLNIARAKNLEWAGT